MIIDASIIKLRAERKLGELLQQVELADSAPGNQYTESATPDTSSKSGAVSLAELGISKSDSSRSQRVAALPEEDFERYLTENAEQQREPSTAGVLRLVKQQQVNDIAIKPVLACAKGVVDNLDVLIRQNAKFSTIYADPPWPYSNQATRAATSNHYPTMSVDAICKEPVEQLCHDNAHLLKL